MANSLEYAFGGNVKSTVNFIRVMNRWSDIMNVKHLYEGRITRNLDLCKFTDRNDSCLS